MLHPSPSEKMETIRCFAAMFGFLGLFSISNPLCHSVRAQKPRGDVGLRYRGYYRAGTVSDSHAATGPGEQAVRLYLLYRGGGLAISGGNVEGSGKSRAAATFLFWFFSRSGFHGTSFRRDQRAAEGCFGFDWHVLRGDYRHLHTLYR